MQLSQSQSYAKSTVETLCEHGHYHGLHFINIIAVFADRHNMWIQ
jgi:hypothetical protein